MKQHWSRRVSALLCALLLMTALWSPAARAADAPDSWAAREIQLAIGLGIIPPDLQQSYTAPITRGEFCRMAVITLQKAARINGWTFLPGPASFDDTADSNILLAAGLGIVSGDGSGSFHPNRGITRQEAAVMLYNTLDVMGVPLESGSTSFTDRGTIATWASSQVSAVVDRGVMNGTGGGGFSPLASYSRQQAYVTFYRLLSSLFMELPAYSYTIRVGQTLDLTCTYSTGASTAAWTSNNPGIVAVTRDKGEGDVVLTGVAPGTTTVTCRSGDYQITCTVTVSA